MLKFKVLDQKGQGLVEVTVAAGILATILGVIVMALALGLRTVANAQIRTEATLLAQESIEQIRSFKDRNWGQNDDGSSPCPPHATCPEPHLTVGGSGGLFFQIPDGGSVCPSFSGSPIVLTLEDATSGECPAPSSITDAGLFRRSITVNNADTHPSWDPSGGIICSDYDCNMRKITVVINWDDTDPNTTCNPATCVKLEAYIAKWKEPATGEPF